MSTSDIIAVGILFLCILFGMFGFFKCLGRSISGFVFGLLILMCISALVNHPVFDKYSHGILQGGKIIPYLEQQTSKVKEFIHHQWSIDNMQSESKADAPLRISSNTKANTTVPRKEQ